MKSNSKFVLLICVIILSSAAKSLAQSNPYHFEAGVNVGTILYQGDLIESPFGSFKGARPMINLWVAKPFTPYFSWRANLTVGSMSADESGFSNPAWKQSRNFLFSTPLTEISGMIVFNPYGDNDKQSYHALTPYIMIGAGASFLNIHRDWSRIDSASGIKSAIQAGITRDSVHALPGVLPVLPIGAGLRWMVTPKIVVNAEASMRFAFTDYIDGFSYSANPKRNDAYYGLSLGVSFIFGGNGVKCPKVPKE